MSNDWQWKCMCVCVWLMIMVRWHSAGHHHRRRPSSFIICNILHAYSVCGNCPMAHACCINKFVRNIINNIFSNRLNHKQMYARILNIYIQYTIYIYDICNVQYIVHWHLYGRSVSVRCIFFQLYSVLNM